MGPPSGAEGSVVRGPGTAFKGGLPAQWDRASFYPLAEGPPSELFSVVPRAA